MRTLLHASRRRKRSIAAATLGALALVGSLLVATPAHAINDTGTGGVFVSATGRVLDTKNGVGGYSTPMEAGKYRTIKIAGLAGIPDDGSVGAVSLNATVGGIADNGTLFGRPNADTSRTMMLIYNDNAGEYVSNTAIVAVSAAGTIQVSTETAARLILDVQGYYTANTDGTAAGGFIPIAGKRIVDTRSGLGAPKALLAPGKSVDIQVTGANGVPAGASGAVVNLLPINSTASDGYLTPYATGATRPDNALHYAPSVNTSIQAQVRLSSSGKMTIYNGSSTINLVIDLQGYFTKAGTNGATFTPGIGRVFDSRATGNTVLAKNETRAIQVAGKAGVPVMGSGITAVVLTLTAAHGGSDGRASVWANGTAEPDTTSINFQTDEIRTNTVTVALGANGKINLNNVAAATDYVVDVQGWYADPARPKVSCDKGADAGSWGTAQYDGDVPVLCTVTAPAASASNQTLDISANGMPIGATVLNEVGPTTLTVGIPPVAGAVTIAAAITNTSDVLHETTYAFGVGDWTKVPMMPSVADNNVVDPDVVLLPILSDIGLFPTDATYEFSLTDVTVGTSSSSASLGSEPFLNVQATSNLVRGHTYAWSAKVKAQSNWTDTVEVSSPVWQFRVAEVGESTTPAPTDGLESNPDGVVFRTAADEVNGCSWSPESWFKAKFTPVCNAHDRCYFSTSKTDRAACDVAFWAGLVNVCKKAYPKKGSVSQNSCIAVTGVYFTAVRQLGKSHYKGKGKKA